MNNSLRYILFGVLIFVLIGCDRTTKDIARNYLSDKESITYWHGAISLIYAENPGGAMSLGERWPSEVRFSMLIVLPAMLLLTVSIYSLVKMNSLHPVQLFSLALIVSGGLGNLIDRLLNENRVIDFMIVGVQHLRTGIFNCADFYVTMGVIALTLYYGVTSLRWVERK